MDSLNRMSLELADEALEFTEELDVGAFELDNGTTVIDFGVEHVGGLEAGLLLNVTRDNVVRLLPPLVLSDAEADLIVERLAALLARR
jgi:methenyltetrahydromethanopterin cyclohydrolase